MNTKEKLKKLGLTPVDPVELSEEHAKRLKLGLQRLRENEKKAKERMRDGDGGRCCLCVLQGAAIEQGASIREDDDELPSFEMADFYGFDYRNPSLVLGKTASMLNDGHGVEEFSHKEIADIFEMVYPKVLEV